ncbi:MAG: YggT family protein [Candidatus Velthaea sp.]|jgi:YggT family protein
MDPLCHVYGAIYYILNAYLLLMLVYALVSWVPSIRGRWSDVVARLVEPVLVPVRRIIPPLGGFDLSFLVVILVIQWVNGAIVARYACPVF